jgi:hypothetical protein
MKNTHAPRFSFLLLAAVVAAVVEPQAARANYDDIDTSDEWGNPVGACQFYRVDDLDSSVYFDYTFFVTNGCAIIMQIDAIPFDENNSFYDYEIPFPSFTVPSEVPDETTGVLYPVIGIAGSGFCVNANISETIVTLPTNIVFLGSGVFSNFDASQIQTHEEWDGTDWVHPKLNLEYLGYSPFNATSYTSVWNDWYVVYDGTTDLSGFDGVAGGVFWETSIRDAVLPSALKILPSNLFGSCGNLGAITIPASVESIETVAFANCSSLTNIVFEGNAPTVSGPVYAWNSATHRQEDIYVFTGVNPNCVVTVQRGTTGWGEVPGTWQGMPIRYADEEPPPAPVVVDLSTLTGDYTASDGEILTNSTSYVVTVPGGATVTINGVTVTGGGGAGSSPATFAEGGEAFTSAFAPGANGTWRLTAYAELASGSAAGLADSQIKVRQADTVAGLATVEPTSTGVTVLEKVPAVKVDLEVAVPPNADSQFFRVEFVQP